MVWHDMNWYDMMQWMGSNLIQNTWITQAATGCQRRKGPGCQPQPTHPLAGAPATRWWLHLVAYIEMMTSHGFESMAQLGKMTEQKGGWTAITAWFPAAQVGWAISIFYNHHLSTILSKFHFCLSNCSFQVIASAATNIGYLRITPLGYMITQKYTGMPHKSGQRSKIHENTPLNDAFPGQLHADLVSLLVGVASSNCPGSFNWQDSNRCEYLTQWHQNIWT